MKRNADFRVLIAGDVVPSESSDFSLLSEELAKYWLEADYRIINLEAPICAGGIAISKAGPNLKISRNSAVVVESMKPDIVCLANNHVLDYGPNGAKETTHFLEERNIDNIGLLPKKSTFLHLHDKVVGIYNVCDREFNVLDEVCTNVYKYDETLEDIRQLKDKCDFAIVIFHAGKERYRYPSPWLREICKKMVDSGADLVTTQHSHCVGCVEEYEGSMIMYGQGNFLFPENDYPPYTDTSVLLEVTITDNGLTTKIIPLKKTEDKHIILDVNGDVLDDINKRAKQIKNDKFVEDIFSRYADEQLEYYLKEFYPVSFYDRAMNKICKRLFNESYIIHKYGKNNQMLELLNALRCNAHRELVIRGIENLINKEKK